MRVIRLLPGPSNLASVIREVADSETVISALNDAWLLAIREMVGEEATIKPFGKLVDEYAERCGVQMSRTAGAGYELAAI